MLAYLSMNKDVTVATPEGAVLNSKGFRYQPSQIVASPSGNYIIVVLPRSFEVLESRSLEVVCTIDTRSLGSHPVISPDDSLIACVHNNRINLYDLDGFLIRQIGEYDRKIGSVEFLGNDRLVCSSRTNDNGAIVIPPNGIIVLEDEDELIEEEEVLATGVIDLWSINGEFLEPISDYEAEYVNDIPPVIRCSRDGKYIAYLYCERLTCLNTTTWTSVESWSEEYESFDFFGPDNRIIVESRIRRYYSFVFLNPDDLTQEFSWRIPSMVISFCSSEDGTVIFTIQITDSNKHSLVSYDRDGNELYRDETARTGVNRIYSMVFLREGNILL
jgi:hypothetical protein